MHVSSPTPHRKGMTVLVLGRHLELGLWNFCKTTVMG
jgi:hypothetical protein